MYAFGFLGLVFGAYLVDSALKGRNPIDTLIQMVREPSNVSGVLARNAGSIQSTVLLNDPTSESDAESSDSVTDSSYSKPSSPASGTSPSDSSAGSGATGNAAKVISFAKAQLGKPYQWGGNGPKSWDCSGLTLAAYKTVGINLGRTTYAQVAQGKAVTKANLAPGDLIFPTPGHVQMYIGDGKIIEAPRTGLNVRITPIGRVWKARRYL